MRTTQEQLSELASAILGLITVAMHPVMQYPARYMIYACIIGVIAMILDAYDVYAECMTSVLFLLMVAIYMGKDDEH